MKSIGNFAKKPELVQIVLDSPDIREEFGDEVVFYMKDYVDINTYFDFFRNQTDNAYGLNEIIRRMILNEQGEPILGKDDALPVNLAVAALSKINENLGKLKTKPLMSETGNPPN
jgi:hypothetical protein